MVSTLGNQSPPLEINSSPPLPSSHICCRVRIFDERGAQILACSVLLAGTIVERRCLFVLFCCVVGADVSCICHTTWGVPISSTLGLHIVSPPLELLLRSPSINSFAIFSGAISVGREGNQSSEALGARGPNSGVGGGEGPTCSAGRRM